MSLEEKFYLLIVDELRAQPGLIEELEGLGPGRRVAQVFGRMSPLLGPVGTPEIVVNAAGLVPRLVAALGEAPVDLTSELKRWTDEATDAHATYMTLARGALVQLLWRNFGAAEDAINLAKYQQDDWAFAHYVYGLSRGLEGDAGRAHFELYLALHREPFPEARERIDRALDLVR